MEFPVDILASLSHEDLVHSSEGYMSDLLYSNPDKAEHFLLPNSRRIPLSISNVGFVPLYGSDLRHKVLALFSPDDQFTAVALYLADQWWAVEDILRTADPSRKGILKVRSLGERIVLYVLNRLIYRSKEMNKNEVPFLCHSASDYAKILWKNGEAVGFYSVKPTGSLCNSFLTQRYLLPVMDSIFVRKIHRGNGYGLQILEDFVDCFKEDSLGLKYPISKAMLKVCGQYLNTYPADGELLWEVESVGGPFQRSRIASKLQSIDLRVTGCSVGDAFLHDNLAENNVAMGEEEVTLVNRHLILDVEDTPVSTRTRSSGYRRKRIREEAEVTDESLPDKITRVDDSATANGESSDGEALKEDGQLAPANNEEGEEQPSLADEVVEPVAQETEEAERLTLEVELLAKVEAEQINGEITDDFEEEGESTGEPAAMKENCTQEEGGGQKDVEMEVAVEDILEDQDTVNAVSEKPEEQTSVVEEEALCGEGEAPKEQESMQDDALAAEQEQTSPVVAVDADEQISITEPFSSQEQASPTKDQTPLVEEEAEVEVAEPSPVMGEALAAEQDSSVNEDTPVDPVEDTVDHQKAPELHEPAQEAADLDVLVPDKVIPEDKEGMEEKIGTEAAPLEKVDSPSPPLDKEAVELSQDAVVLVGLKELTYHKNGDDENDPTAEEVEKMDEPEEEVPKEDETEQGKETEEEKTEEEKATTTEEDDDGETVEQSSDNAYEPLVVATKVLRRKTKVSLATPKRKSTRLNKGPLEDEQPSELEDESTEKEEEKGTTTEEELVERSSDEAEETPIADRRVLRRKTQVIQSPSKPRAKRRNNL